MTNNLRPHLLLLTTLLASAPLFARQFDVRPAPAWADRVNVDSSLNVARTNVRYGVYSILSDDQVRVTDKTTSEYYRRVRKVLSPSGVQNASELNIEFDPSYQRLVLHEVALYRDGQRIEELDPNEVRVIQKESDWDERIYDGTLTALLFLSDVRPGDVIDYSYSLDGANPILAGRYADTFQLSTSIPAHEIRHRLLWPAARQVHYRTTLKGLAPRVTHRGDEDELIWDQHDVAALDVEDELPDWYIPGDRVQLSEFATWNDVARWASDMFRVDEPSIVAIKTLAAKIRAEQKSDEERVTAAIRFVQDDVRYLGIEMGRNSHQPHQPSVTLSKRFGDCKDKAFLLAALLRELGVEAYPALVNTKRKHALDEDLPSPILFDHVIVQALVAGKSYWIDGTISDQGGTLTTLDGADEERALVIRAETQALAHIDSRDSSSILVEQTYDNKDYDGPTSLEVRSTYRGADADAMRTTLATMSIDDLAKEHLNRYAADQPKITANGKPVVRDDRVRNVITVVERYTIRDLWKNGEWTYYPRSVDGHFHRPDTMIRSMPLAFDYPLNITQKLTFNLPAHFDLDTGEHTIETPAFRFDYGVDSSGKTVTITHSLRARKDSVAVSEVADHLTKINEIWDEIGYRLSNKETERTAAASMVDSKSGLWIAGAIIGMFVFGGIATAIGRARMRLRTSRFARGAVGSRPGETAAMALMVRDRQELQRRLGDFNCVCGAMITAPYETQSARYDEREMTIVTRSCTSCGREQALYFSAATALSA